MIFRCLFQKKVKGWESVLKNANQCNQKLQTKIIELKKTLYRQESKFKRLQDLINKNVVVKNSEKLLIEKTKKDIDILTLLNFENKEIKIFNIECDHISENYKLVLWFSKTDDIIKIIDIQGGNSLGHGSIAINHLVDFAKRSNVNTIIGDISLVDEAHFDRLYCFYEKNGFIIDKENRTIKRLI